MNKKFSLETIVLGVQKTVKRFPLVVAVAVGWTVVGLFFAHNHDSAFLARLYVTLILAFPLLIAGTIFTEQRDSRQVKIATFSAAGMVLIVYLAFFSKDLFSIQQSAYHIQYMLWLAGALILATFAPFIQKVSDNCLSFWYYNQRIFYAFLATGIYSATIYIGLSIALLSVNFLFDLNIDSVRWLELWIVIVGLFSTTFFLSRYPHVQASEEETVYPKELKLFTYYVLSPLVCIYFLILYSYTAKIILTWEWPKGIVSSMVLGFSALGVFTYSLLYPLVLREDNLRKISAVFFGILLPQVAVLFWAVWLRVSEYGVTERRYLLIVFGLWLLGISLYFLISKAKSIRVIAVSLFIVVVGISFGPWGIFSVSESSQIHRLAGILQKNGILINDKVNKVHGEVSFEDRKEISEIISYLDNNHGLDGIQPWFDQDLNTLVVGLGCERMFSRTCFKLEQIASLLGITYVNEYTVEEGIYYRTEQSRFSQNLLVSGYDYVINDIKNVDIDGTKYSFGLDTKNLQYLVYKNDTVISTVPLKAFVDRLSESYKKTGKSEFSADDMTVLYEDRNVKMKIYFSTISSTKDNAWSEETVLITFK